MDAGGRAETQSSGLLIRGFGVRVPGGAPVDVAARCPPSTDARLVRQVICDSGWFERHIGEHIRTVLRLGSANIDPKTSLRSLGFDVARMGTSR